MSFAMLRWPLYRHVGYSLLGAVAVFGGATIVFGLSHHFGLSLLALAVTGAADNISVVTRLTLTQLQTPDEIRGRVAAVNSIFIGASNQLGEFESGAVAALWGPVVSVVSGGNIDVNLIARIIERGLVRSGRLAAHRSGGRLLVHAEELDALTLEEARTRGVTRASLFAANDQAARAYRAIGFRQIGQMTLTLFAGPQQVRHG